MTNDFFGVDTYDAKDDNYFVGGVAAELVQVFLRDSTSSGFDDVSLPLIPPSLSQFQERTFFIGNTNPGDTNGAWGWLSGRVDRLIKVPEPGSLALFVAGLLALLFAVWLGRHACFRDCTT